VPAPDAAFLERAWGAVAGAARAASTAVVLGTERVAGGRTIATALVIGSDGALLGFQDKVQLDPSEESTYTPGSDRHIFRTGALTRTRTSSAASSTPPRNRK
jgi:predicted amidohydrolase